MGVEPRSPVHAEGAQPLVDSEKPLVDSENAENENPNKFRVQKHAAAAAAAAAAHRWQQKLSETRKSQIEQVRAIARQRCLSPCLRVRSLRRQQPLPRYSPFERFISQAVNVSDTVKGLEEAMPDIRLVAPDAPMPQGRCLASPPPAHACGTDGSGQPVCLLAQAEHSLSLFACGSNSFGQLGVGPAVARAASPLAVPAVGLRSSVLQVVCGSSHSLFRTAARTLLACGQNQCGQVRDAPLPPSPSQHALTHPFLAAGPGAPFERDRARGGHRFARQGRGAVGGGRRTQPGAGAGGGAVGVRQRPLRTAGTV